MKVVGTLVLFLAVAIVLPMQGVTNPGPAKQAPSPAPKKPNVEIEIARKYTQLGDWSEAEAHFLAAAKDPDSQAEGLAGLENARRKADEAQTAVLAAGKYYEDADMWSKAEDLYRPAAADKSLTEEARKEISQRLALVLEKQRGERRWAAIKDWIERVVGFVVILFAVTLTVATLLSIAKRSRPCCSTMSPIQSRMWNWLEARFLSLHWLSCSADLESRWVAASTELRLWGMPFASLKPAVPKRTTVCNMRYGWGCLISKDRICATSLMM